MEQSHALKSKLLLCGVGRSGNRTGILDFSMSGLSQPSFAAETENMADFNLINKWFGFGF